MDYCNPWRFFRGRLGKTWKDCLTVADTRHGNARKRYKKSKCRDRSRPCDNNSANINKSLQGSAGRDQGEAALLPDRRLYRAWRVIPSMEAATLFLPSDRCSASLMSSSSASLRVGKQVWEN